MYVSYRAYLYVSMLKNRFRISGLLLAYSSALWVRFGILISEIVVTCVYLGSYSFSYFGYTTEVYGNLFNLFNLLQTDINSGGVLYMGVTWRAKFITRWLSLHGPHYLWTPFLIIDNSFLFIWCLGPTLEKKIWKKKYVRWHFIYV